MLKKALIALAIFSFLLIGSCFLHTRHDSVGINRIGGTYLIHFVSQGNMFAPLTPEGAFPRWADYATFQTYGAGSRNANDEITFTIGSDLASQYYKYREGTLTIRESTKEVILDAKLSKEYRWATNHSGKYRFTLTEPTVYPITDFSTQKEMLGKYIKAVGRFDNWHFYSGPYTFEDMHVSYAAPGGGGDRGPGQLYEVVGYVQKSHEIGKFEIGVFTAVPTLKKM